MFYGSLPHAANVEVAEILQPLLQDLLISLQNLQNPRKFQLFKNPNHFRSQNQTDFAHRANALHTTFLNDTDNDTMARPREAAALCPGDRLADWLHCLCVVNFDVELGQSMEVSKQLMLKNNDPSPDAFYTTTSSHARPTPS